MVGDKKEGKRSSLRKKFDATCQPVNTRDTQRSQSMTSHKEGGRRSLWLRPLPRHSHSEFVVFFFTIKLQVTVCQQNVSSYHHGTFKASMKMHQFIIIHHLDYFQHEFIFLLGSTNVEIGFTDSTGIEFQLIVIKAELNERLKLGRI